MANGQIGIEMNIAPASTVQYRQVAAGIGALPGRFLRGPLAPTLCVSEEDFKSKFGSKPLTGYEMDWHFAISFYRASEGHGQLWVWNVEHYTDYSDPATGAAGNAVTVGLSGKSIYFEAYSRGAWPHADKENLQVIIQDSARRAAASGYVDVILKLNGTQLASPVYEDLALDPTAATRNIRDTIPAAGDGYIIPHYDGTKDDPTPSATPYAFTGGADGLSGLVANDWLGAKGASGNTGVYQLVPLLNNAAQRPTFILNQNGGESYEADIYAGYTTFCRRYWLTHFSPTPSGLARDQAAAWKRGDGAYAGRGDRSTTYGEARVSWPWFYPRSSSDPYLLIPPSAADAGRMVARIYASGGHVHEPYAGTDGDQGSMATVTGRLERETGQDDLDTLNPLGIAVINSSLGGIYIDGGRTMATDYRFLEMAQRRHLAVCIAATIEAGSRWMIHGNNDAGYPNSPGIWTRGTLSGQQVMRMYAADGAFSSKEMGVGWFFQLGAPYTTAEDILNRIARSHIAYAPRASAEKIIFTLSPQEGSVAASLATE